MLVYALTLASSDIPAGVIISFLLLAAALWLLISGAFRFSRTEDRIFAAYIVYNLLSGIWTVAFGIPVSVYMGEVSTTALPMVLYYAGRCSGSRTERFYRLFIYSVLFITGFGFLLYVTVPQFYIDFLYQHAMISKDDAATAHVRMYSVIGSTLVGAMSVFSMGASIFFIELKDRKRRTEGLIYFLISLFMAFMSNQRAAMAVAIMIVIFLNLTVFFSFRMFPKKYFAYECAAIAAVLVLLVTAGHKWFMKIYYRLVSLPGAVGQRSDQWVGAVNNMKSMWTGDGLGSHGHRAIGYAEHVVADGGLVKIYCELGIIGTSLFIFLILLIIKKSFRNLSRVVPEFTLIISALLLSIGSDILSFELAAPIFYFAIGRAVSILTDDGGTGDIS